MHSKFGMIEPAVSIESVSKEFMYVTKEIASELELDGFVIGDKVIVTDLPAGISKLGSLVILIELLLNFSTSNVVKLP